MIRLFASTLTLLYISLVAYLIYLFINSPIDNISKFYLIAYGVLFLSKFIIEIDSLPYYILALVLGGILTVLFAGDYWIIGLMGLFIGQLVYLLVLYVYQRITMQQTNGILRAGLSKISISMIITVISAWLMTKYKQN
jgi:hypothetical protein